jgi:hypothetical protein
MSSSDSNTPATWPSRGPAFNTWNLNLREFMALLDDAAGECWWAGDSDLKYLNVRIDTRDNAFVLYAANGADPVRVSPDRVIAAIARHRQIYGAVKLLPTASSA